jgi:hypothetical protein
MRPEFSGIRRTGLNLQPHTRHLALLPRTWRSAAHHSTIEAADRASSS